MSRRPGPVRIPPAMFRAAASLLLLTACGGESSGPTPDLLTARGITVTEGAAAGYVPDRSCNLCHSSLYRSYQEVGMARSLYRPAADRRVEDFDAPAVYHAPSRRWYEMRLRGEELIFRRWQLDPAGRPVNLFERKVDWILGSGHTSRVYLYQTPNGELYQLPLGWYAQEEGWAMAPGYDHPHHEGVLRRVRRECMFCHNAYPDVPAGSDAYGMPHIFPPQLPEGTGCQRCHGPGAEHLRAAYQTPDATEAIRATIVNPRRLPPELRNDVCNQCHLQPSVALMGVRRFDRADYSFRPGEPLSDYLLKIDVEEEQQPPEQRFEINHHAYRLYQSRCFTESEPGALSCLTCHDPHGKVPERKRKGHYGDACLGCHTPDACQVEAMEIPAGGDPEDCVACHMPRRRTQDVVHVVMTDHRIQRRPPPEAQHLAPRTERVPVITQLSFLSHDVPRGPLGEIYRASIVLRAQPNGPALEALLPLLEETEPAEIPPYLDAVRTLLSRRRFAEAEEVITKGLERAPGHPLLLEWLGVALVGSGRVEEAVGVLEQTVESEGGRPEARYSLGRLLLGQGHTGAAIDQLQAVLAERPNLAAAHVFLGVARERQGQRGEAIAAFQRALEIDPTFTRAYLALGEALLARGEAGDREEALHWWRHGTQVAQPPEPILEALAAAGRDGRAQPR